MDSKLGTIDDIPYTWYFQVLTNSAVDLCLYRVFNNLSSLLVHHCLMKGQTASEHTPEGFVS